MRRPLKVLFALPGIHRVHRGAEVALESVAHQLALQGETVTVAGGGPPRDDVAYNYVRVPHIGRERLESLPTFPPLRSELQWEELAFTTRLGRAVSRTGLDVTVTCSFPFLHWRLWTWRRDGGPRHVFVTQNGDWPAVSDDAEARLFGCDGLVCTNPTYQRRNEARHVSRLIPNGVDVDRFAPGPAVRDRYGLPGHGPVVLMVSALIGSKRVVEGIRAVAELPDVFLVVAGDGPLRAEVDAVAAAELPGRFGRTTVPASDMPDLYRSVDAVLHMSLAESFGNVYVEASATGLPVVAHGSETTEWILADDGYRVDTRDRAAVTDALRRALDEERLGAAQRERAERFRARFGWQTIAASYATFLHETVAAAR